MARKVHEPEDAREPVEVSVPTQSDFNKLIRSLKKSETVLSEAKGEIGGTIADAVADKNFHKDALRIVRKYMKKSPEAAAEFMTHLDAYWDYAKLTTPDEDLIETPAERRSRVPNPDAGERVKLEAVS